MEESESKEAIEPMNDGLDICECNSDILCTITIDKNFNGVEIKKEIISCDNWNLNTHLQKDLSPLYLRVSIQNKNAWGHVTWQILGANKQKIGCKKGKCIVEFFDSRKKDNQSGTMASGKSLIFVHK